MRFNRFLSASFIPFQSILKIKIMRKLLIINTILLFSISHLAAQPDSMAIDMQDTTIIVATPDVDVPSDIAVAGGDTILLDKIYFNSFAKPIIAMSGDVVLVNTDSIHLVNNKRFLFYEELRGVIRAEDNCNDQIQTVITKYEVSLERNEQGFNNLLENCNKSSDLTTRLLETTELSLQNTKSLLTDTQTSLAHANDLLAEANKVRKASRRKNTLEKILIGAGGTALGVLVGVLVIK